MVAPGFDLALAMLAGIAIGTLVQSVLGLLSTLLGMFHVMIPHSLIGMYGGLAEGVVGVQEMPTWTTASP
jgi:hypothetical protein